MYAPIKRLMAAAIAIAPVAVLSFMTGCEHTHATIVAEAPVDGVAVAPGYYYDAEYYDVDGHIHPRRYWYYDGHHWDGRDGVPSGYHVEARPHGRVDRHDDHDDHH